MVIIRSTMITVLAIIGLFLSTSAALAYEAAARVFLNVRSGPGTNYGVVDILHSGEVVRITKCLSNGWCYIEHSGPDGWVSSNYLKPAPGKLLSSETFRDQGQILNTDGLASLGTHFFSQSITAGITGGLAAIEVLYEFNLVAPIQYSVYSGGNPVTGDLLYTELIESPVFETKREGVFRWLLPSDTLFFEAGEQFTFAFQAQSSGVIFSASDRPDYIGGELFQNGVPSSRAGDVAFITYVVPAPGSGLSLSPSEK